MKKCPYCAVKQDGYALNYADESFRADREMVLEAVKTWVIKD